MTLRARQLLVKIVASIAGLGILWQAVEASAGNLNGGIFALFFVAFAVSAPAAAYYQHRKTDWQNKVDTTVGIEKIKNGVTTGEYDDKK